MLAEFAVKRWQLTLVAFVALMALGANSLVAIPKAEDPTFPFATFAIIGVMPGSSPSDVERLVVDPIETRLKALDDVKDIKTEIEDGLAVIYCEFQTGVDPERKHDAVLREVGALRPTLPSELMRLEVKQFNASLVNVVELGLVSDTASYAQLDTLARSLKRRIEGVPGVDEVTVAGLPTREVRVEIDLPRMVQLGVSPAELMGAIGSESANIPAGGVDQGARRFNVKTSGDYQSIDEVADTVIRTLNGAAVRVRDVAKVSLVDTEGTERARFDGKRAVLVLANQRDRQNIFDVTKGIDTEVASFVRGLPEGVSLARGFHQADNVKHRLSGFTRDFGLAILLVLATLLPLGIRAALVVMVSIPLSLALGLVMLDLTGYTINQLSIVGFVIALGLLVDDSVVVVENITRHLREGKSPRAAAIAATREITASVLGCTATLLFAFLPLLALPGTPGQFIRSLPLAVVFTIAASLLVSMTVVPFLASVLLKPEGEHGNVIFRAMKSVIERSYRPILGRALARPALTLITAALLFAGSLALVPTIGFSLFPKAGTPQFLIEIEAAEGASLDETDRAARFVETTLRKHPDVEHVAVTVGKGHPSIYYNVSPKNEKANVADAFVTTRLTEAADQEQLYAKLRAELADYPGARMTVREFANGPRVDAPIAFRVLGENPKALEAAALVVEKILLDIPGTRDVTNPSRDRRTDLRVRTDREKAALLGVPVSNVDRAVRLAIGGVVAGRFHEDGSEDPYDIRVTLPREGTGPASEQHATLSILDSLYVATQAGAAVPLSQVARVELEQSQARVRHYNKERSVTVTSEVEAGYNTDRLTQAALTRIAQAKLPEGVRIAAAGEIESREESFGGLGLAILVAAFGVLAILVLEFQTFKSTLIVASVIPLGVVGGMLALFFTGYTLSFTAMIGFVALMGIEVKNSILLVDFTNQLRKEGASLDDAIQRAGEARFIPILLTSLTAIGGLIPLALEHSALYSPLAFVILGGLISSTLLTRVVTPVLYKLLAPEVDFETAESDDALPIAAAPAE